MGTTSRAWRSGGALQVPTLTQNNKKYLIRINVHVFSVSANLRLHTRDGTAVGVCESCAVNFTHFLVSTVVVVVLVVPPQYSALPTVVHQRLPWSFTTNNNQQTRQLHAAFPVYVAIGRRNRSLVSADYLMRSRWGSDIRTAHVLHCSCSPPGPTTPTETAAGGNKKAQQ